MIRKSAKWLSARIKNRFKGKQRDEMLWQLAALYGSLGLYDPVTILRLYLASWKPTLLMLIPTLIPKWLEKLIFKYQQRIIR